MCGIVNHKCLPGRQRITPTFQHFIRRSPSECEKLGCWDNVRKKLNILAFTDGVIAEDKEDFKHLAEILVEEA